MGNGEKTMYIALTIMLVAAMFVLFMCGYYVRLIKEKFGMNWLHAVPVTVAILHTLGIVKEVPQNEQQ